MFIGREAELNFLKDKYEEQQGQLIVLYGRRRIGKTETLKEFCKNKKHILDGKENKILELRSKGISQVQIAKMLNVSSKTIYNFMKANVR